jgi:hypothetical protein
LVVGDLQKLPLEGQEKVVDFEGEIVAAGIGEAGLLGGVEILD